MRNIQLNNDKLKIELEDLKENLNDKESGFHDLQDEIFKSHQDIEDLKKENEEQLSKIENLRQIIT